MLDLPPGVQLGSHGKYLTKGKIPCISMRRRGNGTILRYVRALCPSKQGLPSGKPS